MRKRMTAIRAEIADIINGKYDDENGPRVTSPYDVELRRVVLIGFVVDQYISEGYSSITLDDGSGTIRVKGWGTDAHALSKVERNSLVLLVGKIREYETELYIVPEIIRGVSDPNALTLHKLERLRTLLERSGLSGIDAPEDEVNATLESTFVESSGATFYSPQSTADVIPTTNSDADDTIEHTITSTSTLRGQILQFLRSKDKPVSIDEIMSFIEEKGYDKNDVMLRILDLLEEGVIREGEIGTYELS